MPSRLSDYFANSILGWLAGTDMPAAPATVYVSLHQGDCGVNGVAGTDVTTTVRTEGRVAVDWGVVAARNIENDAVLDFGEAVGAATITSGAIWDAQAGGNCLGSGLLPAEQNVGVGVPVKIPVGAMDFGFPVA